MSGTLDGARAARPGTNVTHARLVTLNYGLDWLSALAFAGELLPALLASDAAAGAHPRVRAALAGMRPGDIGPATFCDAFGAGGEATVDGRAIYARDFQLPTAQVFQLYQAMTVYVASDGRRPLVCAAATAFVGCMTAMNDAGVVAGVDTLRSAAGAPSAPGFNSILLVRHVGGAANDTAGALDTIVAAARGCPYLYSVLDAAGAGAIVEAGAYDAGSAVPDTLSYITDPALLALLPDAAFLAAHSAPDYRHGVYVRPMGYEIDPAFLAFNPGLFARAGMPYNASAFGPAGSVFPDFEADRATDNSGLSARYFAVARGVPADSILVSNFALTPQVRRKYNMRITNANVT